MNSTVSRSPVAMRRFESSITARTSLIPAVTALSSSGVTVANVPVSFSIDQGGIVAPGGTVTGTDGTVAAVVKGGSDTTLRTITITLVGGQEVVTTVDVPPGTPPDAIERLLEETDRLAEVHNTLRAGCDVRRVAWHG